MSSQCPSCGTQLRSGARFCPSCGRTASGAAQPQPQINPAGFTVAAPRPPVIPSPVKRQVGTVIKDEGSHPGTVLYSKKQDVPVCGWLVVLKGRRQGRDFRIEKDSSVLGRDGRCDFTIEDDTVSKEHARIRLLDGKFVLYDLGSANGTYLNGEQVQKATLQDGDVLKVGESLILFKEAKPRIPLSQADVPMPSIKQPND